MSKFKDADVVLASWSGLHIRRMDIIISRTSEFSWYFRDVGYDTSVKFIIKLSVAKSTLVQELYL